MTSCLCIRGGTVLLIDHFYFSIKKMASNQCNNGCGSYLSFVNYEYVNITCIFVKALHFLRLNVLSDVEPALCL